MLWSKSSNGTCAKLHTVAASSNRDHSIIACSRHNLCVALCAHPICGESHFQRDINWEVAITSPPFCCEPQLSHILFVKVAPDTTFTSWSKQHFIVIGKPRRQVCKASHCGSKQQWRSHVVFILFLLVCDTYIWVLFFTYVPFVANRTFNTTLTERLQHLQQSWARLFEMTKRERDK